MDSAVLPQLTRSAPLEVRPIRGEERDRWRSLMRRYHYLGFGGIIGESLYYVAVQGEKWVALLGWGSAALKCGPRDRWIGWVPSLKWRRLRFVANNVRFLILPEVRRPNLASRVLALNLKRLSRDWELFHGHPILLAETFVDPSRFRGTCYLAAGWRVLGQTRGYAKNNRGYWHHGRSKLVLARPLSRDALRRLVGPFPPPLSAFGKEMTWKMEMDEAKLQNEDGLMPLLQTLVDPRKPRGVRHPVATVVAIAVCAALTGARGFTAIAEWAKDLTPEALRLLGSKRREPPSEPTIRRVLQRMDADRLDAQIGQWVARQHPLAGRAVAVDGKTLRRGYETGRRPPHLLSAILHQEGVVIGQIAVIEGGL